jgi:hypothetical protein
VGGDTGSGGPERERSGKKNYVNIKVKRLFRKRKGTVNIGNQRRCCIEEIEYKNAQ